MFVETGDPGLLFPRLISSTTLLDWKDGEGGKANGKFICSLLVEDQCGAGLFMVPLGVSDNIS